MTITLDQTIVDTVTRALNASGDTGPLTALKVGGNEISTANAKMLWMVMQILCDPKGPVPGADPDSSEATFGLLRDYEPAQALLTGPLAAYRPSFDIISPIIERHRQEH